MTIGERLLRSGELADLGMIRENNESLEKFYKAKIEAREIEIKKLRIALESKKTIVDEGVKKYVKENYKIEIANHKSAIVKWKEKYYQTREEINFVKERIIKFYGYTGLGKILMTIDNPRPQEWKDLVKKIEAEKEACLN